jgi:hypothetical protein
MSLKGQYVQKAGVDSWKVMHNGKQKLQTSGEDMTKNKITIKKADLNKKGSLEVTYYETGKEKGWERNIAVFDEKDNELMKYKGNVAKLANSKVDSLSNTYKTIKIYTWSLPTDPEVAATVRIRRVHLCTIIIK